MSPIDKQRIMEVASILRSEARNYYDEYKHYQDATSASLVRIANKNYERYHFLTRIADELDIVAQDNL